MGIGGLPVVLSMMHLSELLPAAAGTIMTIMNVMIDVSSLDLQIFYVSVSNGWCTRQEAFTYYLAVPIAIFVTAPFIWPNRKYEQINNIGYVNMEQQPGIEDVVLEPSVDAKLQRPRNAVTDTETLNTETCEVSYMPCETMSRKAWLKSAPFFVQMRSREFLLCSLFTAVQLLHINLYIGTVDDQLAMLPNLSTNSNTSTTSLTDAAAAATPTVMQSSVSTLSLARSVEVQWYGSGRAFMSAQLLAASSPAAVGQMCAAFSWILPLGGLAMTWPVGAILDNLPLSAAIFMLSLAATVHSVFAMALGVFGGSFMQTLGFVVFAYYRAALFGTMATLVAWSFGHANFGKLWGLLYILSGLLNFCIAPLALLAKTLGSFLSINTASLAVSILLMAYSHWLRQQEILERQTGDCSTFAQRKEESSHRGFGNEEYSSRDTNTPHDRRISHASNASRHSNVNHDLERGLLQNAQ
jgi:hypothetical protein